MENNFLLYFFAFAFLIAWSGVVVCSAYSFIRRLKKDIENHSPQINERTVAYDDKPAYLAVYHLENNKLFFIPKDRISRIYIEAEKGLAVVTADKEEYVAFNGTLRYFLRESPSLQGWDDSRLPVMNWQLDYTFF